MIKLGNGKYAVFYSLGAKVFIKCYTVRFDTQLGFDKVLNCKKCASWLLTHSDCVGQSCFLFFVDSSKDARETEKMHHCSIPDRRSRVVVVITVLLGLVGGRFSIPRRLLLVHYCWAANSMADWIVVTVVLFLLEVHSNNLCTPRTQRELGLAMVMHQFILDGWFPYLMLCYYSFVESLAMAH